MKDGRFALHFTGPSSAIEGNPTGRAKVCEDIFFMNEAAYNDRTKTQKAGHVKAKILQSI